ncbi:MAG: hypothetical protein KGL39_55820 [Patescibacteria group bacterium]|nr:hypothetical protein [Patescibacteria group bacterium]
MAFVQAVGTATGVTGTGPTLTLTTGNVAFAFAQSAGAQTYAVSDTLGNTWTQIGTTISNAAPVDDEALFMSHITNGGSTTVTMSAGFLGEVAVIEYSGLSGTVLGNFGGYSAGSGASTFTLGPTGSVSTVPSQIIGICWDVNGNGAATAGTGYTQRALTSPTGNALFLTVVDATLSSAGTASAAYATAHGFDQYGGFTVVMQNSGAVATRPNLMMLGVGS